MDGKKFPKWEPTHTYEGHESSGKEASVESDLTYHNFVTCSTFTSEQRVLGAA